MCVSVCACRATALQSHVQDHCTETTTCIFCDIILSTSLSFISRCDVLFQIFTDIKACSSSQRKHLIVFDKKNLQIEPTHRPQ